MMKLSWLPRKQGISLMNLPQRTHPLRRLWTGQAPHALRPEFIPAELEIDGHSVFWPDLGMGDMPYHLWRFEMPRQEYFFSSEANFLTHYKGDTNADGGPASLPPLPCLPGVSPSGPPLSAAEKGTHGSLPWRFAQEGYLDSWAGSDWDQSPPAITDYATPAQERAWHLHRGVTTNFREGASPERII